MKKIIKQVLGIDVAQMELVVCLATMNDDLSREPYVHKTFANTLKGFEELVKWVSKFTDPSVGVRYVMEATGVYHESFAYYLAGHGQEVSIVLPSRISHFARSLETKTVTDRTASEAIAQFGLEREVEVWQPPSSIYRRMRQLTRERSQIMVEQTMIKNQLHADQTEAQPNKTSIKRSQKRLEMLSKQQQEIKDELRDLIKTDEKVSATVKLLCSIPGIAALTAATVLAETNGFDLIRNKRQLTSYAGLDVKEKQSGTSIKGKPRISKQGNRFLRKSMHMPALAAIRHDGRFKAIFARLVSKHGIKMKAAVAVQRRLLEMTFTIYKTGKRYDKEYISNSHTELTLIKG